MWRMVPGLDIWLGWHRRWAAALLGVTFALLLVLGDLSAALGRIEVPDLPAHSLQSVNSPQEAREAWCVWHSSDGPVASPSPAARCLTGFAAGTTTPQAPANAGRRPATGLVHWYVGLHLLFVALYLGLAAGAVLRRRRHLDRTVPGQRALLDATNPKPMWLLFGPLLVFELVSAAALLVLGSPSAPRRLVGIAGQALRVAQFSWVLIFLLGLLLICLAVHRHIGLPARVAATAGEGGRDAAAGGASPGRTAHDRRRDVLKAVSLLRFQIIAVSVFCLVTAGVGQDQLNDALRRWADVRTDSLRHALAGASVGLAGTAATVLLALLVWRSAPRVALFSADRAARPPSPILVTAGCAAAAAAAFGWPRWSNLGGLFVALGVVVALSTIGGAPPWRVREPEQSRRYHEGLAAASRHAKLVSPQVRSVVTATARWLAVVPAAMLGIALVRAALPAAIFLDDGRMLVLVGLGLALLLAVPPAVRLLARFDGVHLGRADRAVRRNRVYGLLAAVAALAYLLAVLPPSRAGFPVLVGPVATLALFLMAAVVVGTEVQRWAESTTPVAGLRTLGATRNPVIPVLLAWAVVGSALDGAGAHGVRLLPDTGRPSAIATRAPLTVQDAFDRWRRANCAVGQAGAGIGTGEPLPMVFVASAGGAIRAAYWTAGVLDTVFPAGPRTGTPAGTTALAGAAGCPASNRDQIFALSGVSGGSVGIMYWLTGPGASGGQPAASGAKPWYDEPLTADHLSNAVSWMLNVDLPRVWLGYGGQDRAAALERSWERSQPAMGEPFLGAYGGEQSGWRPLALLNGAAAENGCRALTAPVPLADPDDRVGTGGCRRPASPTAGSTGAAGAATGLFDVAPLFVCPGQDLRVSTAALLSARFPYISPTGKLVRTSCGTGETKAGTSSTYIVDGGYVDRTGVLSAAELYLQLRDAIEEHNAFVTDCSSPRCRALDPRDRPSRRIKPLLLRIDNGYASVAQATDPGRPNELLAPPQARLAVASSMTSVALQRAYQAFGPKYVVTVENAAHPGVQAPLGWVMSGSSRDDLCTELHRVLEESGPVARQLTAAGLPPPTLHAC